MDREVEEFKKGYEEKAVHRIGIIRDEEDKASMESWRTSPNGMNP